MDATFLNELANFTVPQLSNTAVALGAGGGALLVLILLIVMKLCTGDSAGPISVAIVMLGSAMGICVVALPFSFAADNAPTPTEVATAALSDYLTDAHDLTISGPVTLTTADHSDLAHAPGRAEALAVNADGDLVDVTVTWNDPSMDPDDNLVTVITAPATT